MEEVTNKDTIKHIRDTVLSYWPKRKSDDILPIPQPVSIERKDFSILKRHRYVISLKTDGIRYLLLILEGQCYLIDRSFKIFEVECNTSHTPVLSLFDGELMDKKFIIHDCIVSEEDDVSEESFTTRNRKVLTFVNTDDGDDGDDEEIDGITITDKTFYEKADVEILRQVMVDPPFGIDGLILTPVDKPIGMHTQYDLFKWKFPGGHTVDLKLVKKREHVEAYVMDGKGLKLYGRVENSNTEFMEQLKTNCPDHIDGGIVECTYNVAKETYEPLLSRPDKTHPNSLNTVEKTLLNIVENISVDELLKEWLSVTTSTSFN